MKELRTLILQYEIDPSRRLLHEVLGSSPDLPDRLLPQLEAGRAAGFDTVLHQLLSTGEVSGGDLIFLALSQILDRGDPPFACWN